MCIGNEYPYIDLGLLCIGFCCRCEDPVMENERIIRTEAGLVCESCYSLQEEND